VLQFVLVPVFVSSVLVPFVLAPIVLVLRLPFVLGFQFCRSFVEPRFCLRSWSVSAFGLAFFRTD